MPAVPIRDRDEVWAICENVLDSEVLETAVVEHEWLVDGGAVIRDEEGNQYLVQFWEIQR